MKNILALIFLSASAAVVCGQPESERFIPLERCGPLPVCVYFDDAEQTNDICRGHVIATAVPSAICVNVAFGCVEETKRVGTFFPPHMALAPNYDCDTPMQNLYPQWTPVPPGGTTQLPMTTTPSVGGWCDIDERFNRASIHNNCAAYLECSGGYYIERYCLDGYIFYQPFNICVPGNARTCTVSDDMRKCDN